MADTSTLSDWASIINASIPFVGGGGGAIGLYFYFRKIDADNRKLDREKIAEQRTEIKEKNEEIRDLREHAASLQDKLNEAYKQLYPNRGGVTDES